MFSVEQIKEAITKIYKEKYNLDVTIEGNKILLWDTFDTYKVEGELIAFKGCSGASKGKKRIDSYID